MILLQQDYVVNLGAGNISASTFLYVGIAIVGLTVLILVGAFLGRRARPSATEAAERVSSAAFRREARRVGLAAPAAEVLENLVRMCKLKQPLLVFTSAGLLDDTLKKGLYSIDNSREMSPEDKENRKATIFHIKQTIERNARKEVALRSTNLLRPGQLLTITPEGSSAYASKVISNMKDFLTVSAPTQPAGADTRWMRGTPLSVYLWRDNDAGYSFVSKVLGYDTVKGVPSVLISHSRTLRREQRRRNRRREIMKQCFFYPIRIVETGEGRKVERKASVEQHQRTLGVVVDLSSGGCAIQSMTPLGKGRLVMVEFDIDRAAPIRAFGKIIHSTRKQGRGGVMHIMFTQVTRQHLNRISEFVYDFTRPTTTAQVRQQADRSVPGRAMRPGRPAGGARAAAGAGRIHVALTRTPCFHYPQTVSERPASARHTTSPEQTLAEGRTLGARLAAEFPGGAVVLLVGPLGAGKTVLASGIARGWVSTTGWSAPRTRSSRSTAAAGSRCTTWTCTAWRAVTRWKTSAWRTSWPVAGTSWWNGERRWRYPGRAARAPPAGDGLHGARRRPRHPRGKCQGYRGRENATGYRGREDGTA